MKLYIFRCRTRPRLYGATRYETASNLPTGRCSGWEFHERVDLKPDGRLRFAVDTETVRRQVAERGWHIWDETPWESRNEVRESTPPSVPPRQTLQPEAFAVEILAEEVPTKAEESTRASALVQPAPASEPLEEEELLEDSLEDSQPDPLMKWARPSRKEPAESVPVRAGHQRPPEEPGSVPLEKPAGDSRKEAAESVPQVSRQQRPAAEHRVDATAVAPKKTPLPTVAAPRTAPEVSSARPVERIQPEKTPTEKIETPRSVPKVSTKNQVVWFDIPVRDIDRAMRFYSAVLGTPLKKEQAGPGAAIAVLPHAEGAIGGSLVQNMDSRPSDSGPMLYLNTQGRLDAAIEAVAAHGGKVLAEKHSIAPYGFRAIVLDSEGNRIALHSD